ncbi:FAD-dependent oxidoreductase [Mesorhizobium sp. M1A.F.Ca.IN.020.06.1.1]|uniref:GcvT family protein n=1 Tax=unclassified Mesorhizobium TaxID=325217 RepID=UPI000FCAC57F|nr:MULTISPECIES: FAD-dependent oxidoreductase [unclassified Mesorhizobium]RUV81636.1 FAD-dependent oxidoreductase [Mesorhizobium sp. M1A.F.Ca.IN.020.32.1.1]RUW04401.1 FAD-dependent oxidoreductase [Mesorhizobium sp. M1A.F.Ca.IN.022.05.2.1]RUW29154.1 FAD-dependent oxidoreductase [Mesorhizobium sp. M1A.F.Ca.IN.020.06.1.1]RWF82288.1 MAG: FAD-dependent oxidoreductase [Mesorhizobium sp.]RWG04287.1 MAG: FAD-dependent oxidoreductase [Mesorhizobium sp.]
MEEKQLKGQSTSQSVPSHASCLIIGGGVAGCSVAYHLAKLGWRDIVLIEREKLTCGTTWHAAGLLSLGRVDPDWQKLLMYSADLYERLEPETGISTGIKRNGSLFIATSAERELELRRLCPPINRNGMEAHLLSPEECSDRYPGLETSDVRLGMFVPRDGQADPTNVALALAKGARQQGVRIVEGVKATKLVVMNGRIRGAETTSGNIDADVVVNCGGMWGSEIGAMAGVKVPLHACEHFYVVTEPIPGLKRDLPVLRVQDEYAYYKEDAGKLLLGAFETKGKAWGIDGIPEEFCFDQLPEDIDHFEPILTAAVGRLPMLKNAGIRTFFNGPESFTPDGQLIIGEAPNVAGFWCLCGFNSAGIVTSGGAGKALAEWIDSGEATTDVRDMDIRRFQTFQSNRTYLRHRVPEILGLQFANTFPYRDYASARPLRQSPIFNELGVAGACFGELAGWEVANWFAPTQGSHFEMPITELSWERQAWFDLAAAEHRRIREDCGVFDLTSFGKIRVFGKDALGVLQKICANDMDVPAGKIVYTQWLNARGGIEADVTVTRLSETEFVIITPTSTVRRELNWLQRNTPVEASCWSIDVTSGEAVFAVMGPKAREVLSKCTNADLSNSSFPFGTAQEIEFGMVVVRAHRISYVGELGWELYVPTDQARHVYSVLMSAGQPLGLRPCGFRALDSLRIEKAFREIGHDITGDDHILEAGLGFAVRTEKAKSRFGDFVGRDAVLSRKGQGLTRRLMQFKLLDPAPLLYGHEPIFRDGEPAGEVSSGAYGHYIGSAIGLGYVHCSADERAEEVISSRFEIDVAGTRCVASAHLRPIYDPTGDRMRS